MTTISPCLDCRDRRPGCHNPETCKPWAEYEAAKEARYAQEDRVRQHNLIVSGYAVQAWRRTERRKRNRRGHS